MILNALFGYVMAAVEDEKKKQKRQHVGNHRDGLPGKARRTAGSRKGKRK